MRQSATDIESPHQFISRRLQSVLEAPDGSAAVAEMPSIFDRDFTLAVNGRTVGWAWLEEHVRQVSVRLQHVTVEVTHAVRQGNVLMERHIVSAVTRNSAEPFRLEVMAAYELTAEDKIKNWHELTQVLTGEYSGW